ncbi:MAG: hypothetical protein KIT22_08570 [Verrucomicrobiae bacterium]|nr:hypothetical protein [Verrucomicrobiae bacterium]
MSPEPDRLDVLAPVGRAWDHMRSLLFRPFDAARWLAIGFTAWLAGLGEAGGGGTGGNFRANRGNFQDMDWASMKSNAQEWLASNWGWVVPLALAAGLVLAAFWLLVLWLSSRGRFLFFHNVATGRADVITPWNAYAAHGNHLFLFRLVLSLAMLVVLLPLIVVGLLVGVRWLGSGDGAGLAVAAAILTGLAAGALMLGFAIVSVLTTDFVVPIMARHTTSCRQAWRLFLGPLGRNPGGFALYLGFKISLWIGVWIALMIGIVITCCLLGCLLAIPYLGTVLFLPVLVFFRSYSLHFLAQQGPDWNVLNPASVAAPGESAVS